MFTRIVAVLSALVAAANAASVKDCGAGSSLFKIQGLGLTPSSPTPGQDVTLHLEYDVPEGTLITGGTTTYAITLNFIPFQPSTEPSCQDIPCPLGPGSYKNDTVSAWPTGVSGSFTSKMTWADDVGTQLLCVQISGSMRDAANSTALVVRQPQHVVHHPSYRGVAPVLTLAPPPQPKKRGNLRK